MAAFEEEKMGIRSSVTLVLICGFATLTFAQAASELPQPSPEQKKLQAFLGTWKVESEIKENGYVPAGKSVSTETCTSGPAGSYIECRTEGGNLPTRLAIMAYDSYAKAYMSYYASSVLVGTGNGTVDGNTWTWAVEDHMAGIAAKGRTTVTFLSASRFVSKYEMLDANGHYVTILQATGTRVAP